MPSVFLRCLKDQSGATAIEYGLVAALIAMVIIGGATALGNSVNNQLTSMGNSVAAAGA